MANPCAQSQYQWLHGAGQIRSSRLAISRPTHPLSIQRGSVNHYTAVKADNATVAVADDDCLFVGCLTPQQQASVSQGRICSDNFTCCHTEIEVADQTFYLTQSQYTDTGPTSPSADPITPGAWQGSHWSANF